MKKLLTCLLTLALAGRLFATQFLSGTDLATLPDYDYYVANPSEGRSNHEAKSGGLYTMSADRTWSGLLFNDAFGTTPAVFDLGGHTLTLTGCDAIQKAFYFGSQAESTVVISNGTISIVYDPVTYPWTQGEDKYTSRRGGVWGRGNGTLVIAKGGKISSGTGNDTAMALTTAFRHNRLVVQDGGDLDAPVYPWGGADSRIVFEKGAKFSRISSYVSSGGSFPGQNIYYESGWTSNVFELCDEKLLQDVGVTQLVPGLNAKAGSFHCGLALRSSDFDYSVNAVALNSNGKAPILFEILDGAKLTVTEVEMQLSPATGMSGSRLNVDGVGSKLTSRSANALSVGVAANCSNGLVCVSNGGAVDFDTYAGAVNVGCTTGADGNAIEVLSGASFGAQSLVVGRSGNRGNRLTVDGASSVVSLNNALNVGKLESDSYGGGEHVVRVSNGAKLTVGGDTTIGGAAKGCRLAVEGANVVLNSSFTLGGTSAYAMTNAVRLLAGAILTNNAVFIVRSEGCELMVSNSTFVSKQLKIGTEANAVGTHVTVAGRNAILKSTNWGTLFKRQSRVDIVVPRNGFASAPLVATGDSYISFDDDTVVNIDVSEFLTSDANILTTELISCEASAITGQTAFNAANIIPAGVATLRWSDDRKHLYLRRKLSFIMILR